MAELDKALLATPVLRTMLALDNYDQGQRLAQGREVMQVMEVLRDLAAIQSLPSQTRFREAQANKAEYEMQQLAERDRRVAEASQRRLTPTELSGPQPQGQGPLMSQPDFGGFVMDMLKHPSTAGYGAEIGKAVSGEYKNVPRGGQLLNTLTGQTVQGRSLHPISQIVDLMRQSLEEGDMDMYESAKLYHDRLTTRGSGDRSRLMEEALKLVETGQSTGLNQQQMDRLQAIQGYLSSKQVIQTPAGPQVIEGMEIPAITAFIKGGGRPATASPGAVAPRPTALTPGEAPPAPRPQKDITEQESKAMRQRADLTFRLQALVDGFEDKFTNNFPADPTGIAARIKLEAADRGYGDRSFANWWRGLYEPFAIKRHELFGATLTPKEDMNFNRLVASLQSDPSQVYSLLREMLETSKQESAALYKEKSVLSDPKIVGSALMVGAPNPYLFGKAAIDRADKERGERKAQKPTRTERKPVEHEGTRYENVEIRVFPSHREYFVNGQWHRAEN